MNGPHYINDDLDGLDAAIENAPNELLEEIDGDCQRRFWQDAEGHTEVAPDKADWTKDEQ